MMLRKARSAARRARWRLADALRSRSVVHARGARFTLQCDNWITQFRLESFETKEPETLDWIDAHVRDGDRFFDVGGNIGVFALYAAVKRPGATVIVFEPEYANLHLLRDNITANGLTGRVHVYPIALSERTGLSRLHVQDLTPGAALHSESAAARETTDAGERVVLSEGAWAMTLDDFCREAGVWPDVMKIDVDGAEARMLAGARATLARPALRSVIVEGGPGGLEARAGALLQEAGLRRIDPGRASEAGNEVWSR